MPRFSDDQYLILSGEFTKEDAACIGIESQNILVEPDLPASQCGDSLFLHYDFLNREFCEDITLGVPCP